jgi:protein-L-isoaspartate(D-aspartate) O-methyltransferase
VTIERIPSLASWGEENLRRCGFGGVTVVRGDGSLGFPPRAPYDCIVATAGAPRIPETWASQLSSKGRIVAPVGRSRFAQELVVAHIREDGTLNVRTTTPCAFVPLVGVDGWEAEAHEVEGG